MACAALHHPVPLPSDPASWTLSSPVAHLPDALIFHAWGGMVDDDLAANLGRGMCQSELGERALVFVCVDMLLAGWMWQLTRPAVPRFWHGGEACCLVA